MSAIEPNGPIRVGLLPNYAKENALNFLSKEALSGQAIKNTEVFPRIVAATPVLQPGRNCWTIASGADAAVLVDAAAYFCELEKALRTAERSIMIIGWDFDGRIRLCPDNADDEETLGGLLRSLVEARPDLEVRILVWSVAVAHAPSAPLPLLVGSDWDNHARIQLRLDTEHPIYAAHHQKIVCIDDALAFAGGMDLTVSRWDTNAHEPEHASRVTPEGEAYGPVHDVQMMVNGEAARHLAALAAERWRRATGETLPLAGKEETRWPAHLPADFRRADIAIARTAPAWGTEPAVEEIASLTVDALRAARKSIYIEAQYFSCSEVCKALAELLEQEDGPEIVVVAACSTHGVMERLVMGNNRDRMIRHLRQVDRYDRLRVYYPAIEQGESRCEILVHAKVMIIDDKLLRIGSANLNNRSRGLDTECDLAIEAASPTTRRSIAAVRNRLVAEHLGADAKIVARTLKREGSLITAIERLNLKARRLCAFDAMACADGPCDPMFGTAVLDPARPLGAVATT